ncbi:MAG: hypothetical protein PHQ47_02675 [Candidatus Portnoybacteria bacterium]|nr:hypothetical protein [Candidatus Portnoybacteria bacterium]
MKVKRITYYCTYTKNNEDLPKFSKPFSTLEEAKEESTKLSEQGFWGAIERHHEEKQDNENDLAWNPDWDGVGDDAVKIIEYF